MPGVSDIIREAAARYGMDPDYFLKKARIESSGNPNDVNPKSGAAGLFQFIPSTWKRYGNGADPRDPVANTDAAMRFTADNVKQFTAKFGRQPTPGEMYLMHQQGAGGAAKLLTNPQARAGDLVGDKAVNWNGGNASMTGGQFAQLWTSKFDGAKPIDDSAVMARASGGPSAGANPPMAVPPGPDGGNAGLGALFASVLAPMVDRRPVVAVAPEKKKPSAAEILSGSAGPLVLSS